MLAFAWHVSPRRRRRLIFRCTVYLQLAVMLITAPGCHLVARKPRADAVVERASYQPLATQIDYPDAEGEMACDVGSEMVAPFTARGESEHDYWELGLEEVISMTLAHSRVIRDVGGRATVAPDATRTVYDPAIQESSPLTGTEAALSAFDAQFATGMFWNRHERAFNNFFFGGGAASLAQVLGDYTAELGKTAATGTQFAMRNVTNYNWNTAPTVAQGGAALFRSAYTTTFEMEIRHPLLQGAGMEFNRIAGPNARPGSYNGVMLARINTDVALADFEIAVRDHLWGVEQAYWQLYMAYRILNARVAARDAALEAWRAEQGKLQVGGLNRPGVPDGPEQEALARQGYYLAQAGVENALSGVATGVPGVYRAEQELRRLIGLPANDGRLIRPTDEPTQIETVFAWDDSLQLALTRRPELRRQQWSTKRRELELRAARNFLKGRFDLVGNYRWTGFGDNLFGSRGRDNGSAFDSLFGGDLQGWTLGMQYSTPVGNRIGHAAVRNAELLVARAKALLDEQQRQVANEISGAFTELDRSYLVSKSTLNRAVAAHQQKDIVFEKQQVGYGEYVLEFVLNAIQRATEAELDHYQSLVDYSLAIASLHRWRGTYLDYLGVQLAEAAWSSDAHASAARESRRFRQRKDNYCLQVPRPVSRGPYPQSLLEQGADIQNFEVERSAGDGDFDFVPNFLPDESLSERAGE